MSSYLVASLGRQCYRVRHSTTFEMSQPKGYPLQELRQLHKTEVKPEVADKTATLQKTRACTRLSMHSINTAF